MSDNVDNLVLEHLRAIRAKQDEHSDALAAIRLEVSSMGQQLGALTTSVYSGKSEVDTLRKRIERIERRLELTD